MSNLPTFWVSLASLFILSLIFIWLPFFYQRKSFKKAQRAQTNLNVFKERMALLNQQELIHDDYQQEKVEIQKHLIQDTQVCTKEAQVHSTPWFIPVGLTVFMLLSSFGFYVQQGQVTAYNGYGDLKPPPQSEAVQKVMNHVDTLREAIRSNPKDIKARKLLAEFYMEFNLYEQALSAYKKIIEISQPTAYLLAQQATALYFINKQKLTSEASHLIQKALKLDPTSPSSLSLLAIDAYLQKNYSQAIEHWQTLLNSSRTDLDRQAISNTIAETQSLQEARIKAASSSPVKLVIHLDVATSIQSLIQPSDTLFVFAKATEGPPMPIAAIKRTNFSFPMEVVLTDAQSMRPNVKLSDTNKVSITATISHSGEVPARAGDLQGKVNNVATKNKDIINIKINKKLQ